MEQIEFEKLKRRLAPGEEKIVIKDFPENEIDMLTAEQASELVALYGSTVLIPLPEREARFFAWLKEHDLPIWVDLWGQDEESYNVALGHLHSLLPKQRGFPICDLVDHYNYYFTKDEITEEDGDIFLKAALDIVQQNGQLSMDKAFIVEVWRAPIAILQ